MNFRDFLKHSEADQSINQEAPEIQDVPDEHDEDTAAPEDSDESDKDE